MPTRSPTAPRAWQGPVFLFAGLGLAAGIAAAETDDLLRRFSLLLLLLSGLGLAQAASARHVPLERDAPMGGQGYKPPESRAVRALHAVLSLAHNGGIMVV